MAEINDDLAAFDCGSTEHCVYLPKISRPLNQFNPKHSRFDLSAVDIKHGAATTHSRVGIPRLRAVLLERHRTTLESP